MKTKTRDEVERMKSKAVRFVRDVLNDDERADEIEDEELEDYAERKHVEMVNPNGRKKPNMPKQNTVPSRRELEERVAELEDENDTLKNQIDTIRDVVNDSDDDDSDDGGDDDDDSEDSEDNTDDDDD